MWQKKCDEYNTAVVKIFAATHAGRVLKKNEDRFLVRKLDDNSLLCAVADGLGGESKGDVASETVRRKLADIKEIPGKKNVHRLSVIAREIDYLICKEGEKRTRFNGMGSTLVAVLLQDAVAYWVHAGDSRLYLLRNKNLIQITEDQTLARFLLEESEITPAQLNTHYSRYVMDQYLGCGFCEPEEGSLNLRPGDILIISTDGLHKYIDSDRILSIIMTSADIESKVNTLICASLQEGGEDNITVIGIEILHI